MTDPRPADAGSEGKVVEVKARTVDEAVARGLVRLGGLSRSEVKIDVVSEGKSGLLGFGAEEAFVRLTVLLPGEKPPEPKAKAPEPRAKAPAPIPDRPAEARRDRPAEPRRDRPAEARRERPAEPRRDRPAEPRRDKPAEPRDRPAEARRDRPAEPRRDRPAEPRSERPAEPRRDRPAEPRRDRPAERGETVRASDGRRADRADEPREELTPADLDLVVAAAVEFLQPTLTHLGYGNVTIVRSNSLLPDGLGDDRSVVLTIRGEGTERLLEDDAKPLLALQFLTRMVVSRGTDRWVNLLLDVGGDRARHILELCHLAEQSADLVERDGRPVSLPPMSPYERRVVHLALRTHETVVTQSIGVGDYRKVTVRLKDQVLPNV